jgi:NAD(P)H-dependent FMN reductase
MHEEKLRLAVIIASTRSGRFGSVVAAWFLDEASKRDALEVAVIDLADADLRSALALTGSSNLRDIAGRLEEADAYVIVTPEYNHGYPAGLKAIIDVTHTEWKAKPVGFVSYGGMSGGLRAVEQLRQIFAEMHTVTIRDSVAFSGVFRQFDDSGQLKDPTAAQRAAAKMLWQLEWWGEALRSARKENPYAA